MLRRASENMPHQGGDANNSVMALVARQPIFDVQDNVPAYELLFRDPALKPDMGGKDSTAATATVLVDGFQLIRPSLRPWQRVFINFTEESLESGLATMLPPELCVVEVLESVRPFPAVMQVLQDLKRQGYSLALDDYVGQQYLADFLPLVDIVKVDVSLLDGEAIRGVTTALHEHGVTLLAEKVETLDTFHLCRDLKFSLFQGYFFGEIKLIKGKKLASSQAARFRLISQAAKEESRLDSVAEAVMADIAIAFNLLSFINSVHFSFSTKVSTIKQAIRLLGRRKFHQWLCVTVMAELDTTPMSQELACAAALRGKFLELLALHNKTDLTMQKSMAASLFLLGLFSLLENILGMHMEDVWDMLPLEEEILEALVEGTGPYASWLDLIKAYECGAWDRVDALARSLGLSPRSLKVSYTEAAFWASAIFNAQPPAPGKIHFSLKKLLPDSVR